jgi:hypothetical protein
MRFIKRKKAGNPLETTTSFEDDLAAMGAGRWEIEVVGLKVDPPGRRSIPAPPCSMKLSWHVAAAGLLEGGLIYHNGRHTHNVVLDDDVPVTFRQGDVLVINLNLVVG